MLFRSWALSVGGSHDKAIDPAAIVAVVTTIVKGPMDAVLAPLLAVMVTSALMPTMLWVGVPASWPVVLSKVAQLGCPLMEKVTLPADWVTVGWN